MKTLLHITYLDLKVVVPEHPFNGLVHKEVDKFQKGDAMRTKLLRFSVLFIFSILFLGLLVGVSELNSWLPYDSAAASNGPQLSIPSNIPASPNSTVVVPVTFTSGGNNIASTVFSIDYDETWLMYDDTIPNAITFNLPSDFSGGCSPDITDSDGEIDCFILDPLVPLASLPDGVILNIILRTKNPPTPVAAKAGFSANSPPASFGGTAGQSVPGTTLDGSVQIGAGLPSGAYLPIIWYNLISPPTPIPSPTVTVTPTDTPVPTVTPSPGCSDLIDNSGFENSTAWEIPITNYSAGYSTERPRNGLRSMRTGIDPPDFNRYSYSSARQKVSISSSADSATLSMWVYPISGETSLTLTAPELTIGEPVDVQFSSGDFQYILVLDQYNNLIASLDIDLSNRQKWTHKSFDLLNYRGWGPIKIHFGTYNNGYGGVTAMYVDDVTLEVCK
jgi:hypothetical protein